MIAIVKCWHQFGRRYFWPHVLLSMLAASFSISTVLSVASAVAQPLPHLSKLVASSQQDEKRNYFYTLYSDAIQQKNHWQPHSLRLMVRCLSWALTTHSFDQQHSNLLQQQKIALLDALSLLLFFQANQYFSSNSQTSSLITPVISHQPEQWLASIQGIRAGPKQQQIIAVY